ncbi:MAG: hypothetical protein QF701_00370 [Nitrospinota bacterium]|jgi:hypothetical protein|nr:hypothetical protein [Nitrospinota bacterium]MDP6364675.1 hypothetical protein [Nitrospinota bacterium]MDP7166207.1 hypothetical protein [Nitrospinota bacterium]MDP7369189.1 hypothetical protein [Nitrospinota bacterium]MDP7505501.1 hypothetical protein [Nitrospinota bacterium]
MRTTLSSSEAWRLRPDPSEDDEGEAMNPLGTCPNEVISETGEPNCFDPVHAECTPRPSYTVRDFCRNDYRKCPYYNVGWNRVRFGGERIFSKARAKILVV